MEEDQEIIREFLIESNENLARFDQEMVELEGNPTDAALLASIFRTIHTIKGTCGFLGFTTLEAVTHVAENLLSRLRSGEKQLTPAVVTLILSTVDAARKIMSSIEENGTEGSDTFERLRSDLEAECYGSTPTPPVAELSPAVPVASIVGPEENKTEPLQSIEQPSREPDVPPASAAASADPGFSPRTGSVAESTIRVDIGLLDKLMTLVGELVLTRNQILQCAGQDDAPSQRLNLITTELQESVMRTRMQPIGVVWGKLPRVVRDLAASCGKQIVLNMQGADTEIDKTIIEAIKDPLTHIVRNSCDHGLEAPGVRIARGKPAFGTLSLRAFHEGGHVNIEIADDGAGIDGDRIREKAVQKGLLRPEQATSLSQREAIDLIFLPGFSTAEQVTNISGRGVGMDVVRTNIEKIGGSIELSSTLHAGTTMRLKIPLTLAIIPGLVVHSGGLRFVIPQASLVELVRLEGDARERSIHRVYGSTVFRRRGALLPLADLNQLLRVPVDGAEPDAMNIVVVRAGEREFGIAVDAISDTQEIVVKPLGKQLKNIACYAGATIMGDGKVALILDVKGIAQTAGLLQERERKENTPADNTSGGDAATAQAFLLFRAGALKRLAVPLSVVARLEEIPRTRVEQAAGRMVVQYRNEILRLVSLAECLGVTVDDPDPEVPLQVIVVTNGTHSVGLIVEEVQDIVEDHISGVAPTSHAGLLGSAVIGGRITDLVDLQSILRGFDPCFDAGLATAKASTVLLADPSPFARGILRTVLEVAGYRVVEAGSQNDALALLTRETIDAVLLATEMPAAEADRLLGAVAHQPVIAISAMESTDGMSIQHAKIAARHARYDRESVLRSLQSLMATVAGDTAKATVGEHS